MQDYESEDQQIEALKKWWQENSKSLMIGVAVGLAGIFGWREYNEHALSQNQLASDLYNVVQRQANRGDFAAVNKLEQLQNEFADSPYAVMAAMTVASYHYDKGDVAAAIKLLRWAEANTPEEETRHLARVRLASILLSEQRLDDARALLMQPYPEAFEARYEELKGDLYVAEGEKALAIEAYDKAIEAKDASISPLLELKRKDLGS